MSEQLVQVAMTALQTVWQVDDYAVGRSLFREGWMETACTNDKQLFAYNIEREIWEFEQLGRTPFDYPEVVAAEYRDDYIGAD